MIPGTSLFDTRIDTLKYIVPMTTNFKLRNYINKDGLSPIYMHVNCNSKRERISLDISVDPKHWCATTQVLKGPKEIVYDDNLMLEHIKSKINNIKVFFRLQNKILTLDSFLYEFKNELPRANFVKFFKTMLDDRKSTISKGTYKKELAIYRKLQVFQPEIIFHNMDLTFFDSFRNYLGRLGNNKVTRNGNIKIIKKYLRYARKHGVTLPFEIDDVKAGPTKGDKKYLNQKEVSKCMDYYFSSFIAPNHKLALGYFLFSCFTGLRFSDTMAQQRHFVLQGSFTFTHVKTGKPQVIKLNQTALGIVKACEDLFIKQYSNNQARNIIKQICGFMQINKDVDYHTSRHTFGTNYIMLGGDVTRLQILMNHSDIRETMTYVHLAELERNAESFLMDNLYNANSRTPIQSLSQ